MSVLKAIFFTVLFVTVCSAHENEVYANFHEIHPGRFYRSAQMTGGDFEAYIKQYGIRTVINLRGENLTEEWFRQESEVMTRLGVQHVNIPMSAGSIPHRKNLIALLEAFRSAPRPLLVHCSAGADRTGEASALYQMIYMNKTKAQALKMLSLHYGHLKCFKPAKDYFIEKVWKGLDWAYAEYEPCSGNYRYYDVNSSECKK